MKWKLIRDVDDIPRNSVLRQVNGGFRKSILVNLSKLRSQPEPENLVVLEYFGTQKIMRVGKDVVPYSFGVRD